MTNIEVGIYNSLFIPLNLEKIIADNLTVILVCIFAVVFLGATAALGLPQSFVFSLDQLADEIQLFISSSAYNPFYFIYITTAIGFIFLAILSEKILIQFMRSVGKIYILTGFVGIMIFSSQTVGLLVSVMNLILGFSSITLSWILREYRQWMLVARIIAKKRETSCTVLAIIKNSGFKATKFGMDLIPAS